jgi:hypothetical protein
MVNSIKEMSHFLTFKIVFNQKMILAKDCHRIKEESEVIFLMERTQQQKRSQVRNREIVCLFV